MLKKAFYWIGLVCSSLTLSVGSAIFILWWAARAFFAIDLSRLGGFGLMWIIISVPLALIGLVCSGIAAGYDSNSKWFKDGLPFIISFSNIPALWIILTLETNIAERTYFELRNRSDKNIDCVTLESVSFTKELGSLKPGASLVSYYVPRYLGGQNDQSMPAVEEVRVVFHTKADSVTRTMPYAMMGWCERIAVTDSLTLQQ
ncbi:MAG: hypothetical protein RIF36_24940 [Imperialibacter sp.]|uniref:hypothetical protein n=1 Tax=Imperialibacter sp. TaxID=2038411 RepID=UPI0032EEAD8F